MKSEWDEIKNQANLKKHDIDFNDSLNIFNKPLLVRLDDRKDYKQVRLIGIGSLEEIVVVMVFTRRKDRIRIISIRKANKSERRIYHEKVKNNRY